MKIITKILISLICNFIFVFFLVRIRGDFDFMSYVCGMFVMAIYLAITTK